jgi:hypothetical protein
VLVETVETGAEKLVMVGRTTTPPGSDDEDDVDEEEVCEFGLLVVIGGRIELDEGLGGEVEEPLLEEPRPELDEELGGALVELLPDAEGAWLELDEREP